VLLSGVPRAQACKVPVFRYALERWQPEVYLMTIFTTGALTQAEQELVDWLRAPEVTHHLLQTEVDDVTMPAEGQAAQRRQQAAAQSLPWCALDYPPHLGVPTNIWCAPLQRDALALVPVSPARREIAQRLARDNAVVWLLLECGNAARDEEIAARLAALLEDARTNILLPHQIEAPEFEDVHQEYDTNLVFFPTLIRVVRTNEAEAVLIRTLTHVYPELLTTNEPVAFPIIGRGRAFTALIGEQIARDLVMAWSALIAGPCACEIKEQNPGIDLFIPCDWDAMILDRMVYDPPAPPLTGFDAFRPPDAAASGTVSATGAHAQTGAPLMRNLALVTGAALLLVTLGTLITVIRRR